MMKFSTAALSLFILLLCLAASVPAATFTVNTTADTQDVNPGDGVCVDSGGACSFRAAITESNALAGNDVITLPAGTYTQSLVAAPDEIDNAGGDWNVRGNVTINGAGAANTILQAAATQGTATERVIRFMVLGNNYTLNGVTVQHGKKVGPGWLLDVGGGVYNGGSNLTINNSLILHNSSSQGGGIFTYGTLTLNNTTVTENSCVSSGSACLGGGISNDNLSTGNLLMTNSQVVFNTATATGPDGIAIGAGVGISGNFFVSITGSNISNNTGSGTGSGGSIGNGLYLANNSDGTVANLTNSTFNNNSGAGGLAHDGSGVTIFNSQRMTGTFNNVTIEGNTGTSRGAGLLLQHNGVTFTLDINNSAIRGNSGGAYGGGVMVSTFGSFAGTSTVNFLNTTISGNSASVIGGGVALASYATAGGATSTVNFLNTTISGNASSGTGGGVHIGRNSSGALTANFNYTTVTNNTANFSSGGGIYAWTGTANLKNSVFAGNIAPIGADLSGTVNSQNFNHIGEPNNDVIITGNTANNGSGNPMLGPLQVNGSGQPTHLPLAGSPLIDKILKSATNCGSPSVALDQRSMSRPQAGRCDMGSAEVFFPAGPFSLSGRVTTADGSPLRNVTVTITGGALPESGMAIYTGSLGYYSFNSLPGAVYTVAVKSRRFTVSGNVQTVTLNVSTLNVDFTADPQFGGKPPPLVKAGKR